ncbi:MAG: GSCFA domain-containing protein [Bacteroidales bacterium]|jgi:hypothetical protein|nr:GSCFA domain-containing protein [Bacteroidales bacterium]MDD3638740.1 GSCFA domain-containing protein [Bacteroidales bacterium]MDY0358437.1 GSCFA domain-containing protein [Bacteroidales bacterium]
MEWQTKVKVRPLQDRFTYATRFLFCGSCFAQEMALRMHRLHFQVAPDAFGTLFNPASVASALERLEQNRHFELPEVMKFPYGAYGTLHHHTSFSAKDPAAFLENANKLLQEASAFFQKAEVIVVTFGTAWVYTSGGRVAANCHKLPPRLFDRVFLDPRRVTESMAPLLERHRDKLWIMTVSPIRHLGDGAHGNQLSKASLLLAIDQLQQSFGHVFYFPSYEIVLDELRDYRFYASDRCHLTQETADHILERFLEAVADEGTRDLAGKVGKLNASLAHKPFFPESEEYALFSKKLEKQVSELLQTIGNKRKLC